MKKKIIIGFIGDHNVGKTTASNILRRKGFYKASINNKVEEFAKHLFPDNDLGKDRNIILNRIRRKGCEQCKEYWLNLILISVPDDKNFIVFDDLSIDEASSNKISVYQIVRPGVTTIELPDLKTIVNNSSLKDFTSKIDELFNEIAHSS
jgi:GTPase SAR1 family protein